MLIGITACENDLAVPAFSKRRRFTGGLSRLLKTGYVDRIVKLDYNSLYPSIILTWHIVTALDIMGVMPAMLEYVLTGREKYKGLKKKAGKTAKQLRALLETLVNKELVYFLPDGYIIYDRFFDLWLQRFPNNN